MTYSMHDGPAGLPREVDELAVTYGVEARRLHADQDWEAVRDDLAAGWPRIRRERFEWRDVACRVEAGWYCRVSPNVY